jgi:putative transposase
LIFIYKVSIRRICSLFSFPRSSYYYKEAKDNQAIVLIQKIKDIATTRVRYGYRRIHILLKRQGFKVNHKRIYRLYKETGLQLRNKTPKRRVKAKARKDQIIATAKNDCWSMDFMSDQLFTGQKLRILTIVDNFTKLSPIIDVGFSYKGSNVVLALEKATVIHGLPKVIKVDNGPEFISKELDLWAYSNKVELDYSRPGKPTDNAFIESFNGKVRQECLNQHWFLSLSDAKVKLELWREDYNSSRPHSSLNYMSPVEFTQTCTLQEVEK